MKLVFTEPETDALIARIVEADAQFITSELTRTELMRAVRRHDRQFAAKPTTCWRAARFSG